MKALILCDGSAPSKQDLQREITDCGLFIAADGGALTAKKYGLNPDIIIGDMDSYQPDGRETTQVIYDPDQETNDLEKALSCALGENITDVVVYGATGKRLDHTLKNLSVMKQFDSRFDSLIFRDSYSEIFLVKSPFEQELPVRTQISLFPLSGRVEGITTHGVKYPLRNETLENGVRDGSSNLTTEHQISIEFKKGDLLLFVNHKSGRA